MTTTTDPGRRGGLYRLLAWLSPSFPIGAFSYSHGLEAAAASGAVHDRTTLQARVAAIVVHGSGRVDADILRDAYRAAESGDTAALYAVNALGLAFRATAELALESAQQGDAFRATWRAAWPISPQHRNSSSLLPAGEGGRTSRDAVFNHERAVSYPAAFGAAAAGAGIALEDALLGYLQGFAANLVSAGLRLGVIGQTDGQRILAALEPAIAAAADAALTRLPEDFGSATFAADLASMEHETQYSRLFRS